MRAFSITILLCLSITMAWMLASCADNGALPEETESTVTTDAGGDTTLRSTVTQETTTAATTAKSEKSTAPSTASSRKTTNTLFESGKKPTTGSSRMATTATERKPVTGKQGGTGSVSTTSRPTSRSTSSTGSVPTMPTGSDNPVELEEIDF